MTIFLVQSVSAAVVLLAASLLLDCLDNSCMTDSKPLEVLSSDDICPETIDWHTVSRPPRNQRQSDRTKKVIKFGNTPRSIY